MGSFFSALIGGYASTALQRRQAEQKREDDAKLAEANALGIAIQSGRLTDEGFQAAIGRIEELSETKSKKGQESPLRSVLTKLRGKVPAGQQYQPQTLAQTVAKQNPPGSPGWYQAGARDMSEVRPEGTKPGEAAPGSQAATMGGGGPRAFLTQQEIDDRQIALAKKKAIAQAQAETQIATDTYRRINQIAAGITDPETRRSFLYYMKALPPEKRTKVTFLKGIDPETGHQTVKAVDDDGAVLNTFDGGLPVGTKPQRVTVKTPDGKISQAWESPGGVLTDAPTGGKPLPPGTTLMASSGYYPELHPRQDSSNRPMTKAQRAADFNRTLATFRQLESQANTALNQARTQANTHYLQNATGGLNTDISSAQADLARAQRALAFIQAHKSAVENGTEDAQDISDTAQDIINGVDVPDDYQPPSTYKVGDSVMYQGKPHTIKAIRPDGKLVLND